VKRLSESDKAQRELLSQAASTLITLSGDLVERDGLRDTPRRFAEAFSFLTSGTTKRVEDVLTTFDSQGADELVFQGSIPVWSLCEHHLLPFFGVAHIGYIPNGRIIGLSKFARIVDVFARRLQVQERLTAQIADALAKHLTPQGVGVVLKCRHACMEARGIKQAGTVTMTSALRGCIKDEAEARAEFFALVNAKHD
jgi:GTP cyclohydrolase I